VPRDWELVYNQLSDTDWFICGYGITPLSDLNMIEFVLLRGEEQPIVRYGMLNETVLPSETVDNVETIAAPAVVQLNANYPNPFNPKTTIRYELPTALQVNLAVYNISGQLIKTLTQTEQAAGAYAVVWDGTNDRGQAVPSGLYVYRLQAGEWQETQSMVLLR